MGTSRGSHWTQRSHIEQIPEVGEEVEDGNAVIAVDKASALLSATNDLLAALSTCRSPHTCEDVATELTQQVSRLARDLRDAALQPAPSTPTVSPEHTGRLNKQRRGRSPDRPPGGHSAKHG